ncbi:FKBP-type peptidyl-prolyl cis-trans isomerase [Microbacterium aurum]
MRLRPFAALSAVALSAILLAGCSGSGGDGATPSASASGDPSACIVDAPSGSDSEAVTVDGSAPDFTVSVPDGLAFSEVQRTVLSEGDGEVLGAGSLVSASYQVLDGATGEVLLDSADTSATDDGLVPLLIDASQPSMWAVAADCNPLGSTVVLTVPGSAIGDETNNYVIVAHTDADLPRTATGTPQEPQAGLPTVTLAEDGTPTITIPDTAAPTDLQIEVLKQGDGAEVADGDQVTLQYAGVSWDTKEEFDSSWSRGAPSAFTTTGVYEGFGDALVGQKVGSQVLVVMPPSMGDLSGSLKDQTLTFVIDILGTQHGVAAASGQ